MSLQSPKLSFLKSVSVRIGDECYMLTINLKRKLGLCKVEAVDPEIKCHGVPLGPDFCKINIISCLRQDEELPRRHPGGDTVGESVGTFVAWPKKRLKKVSSHIFI